MKTVLPGQGFRFELDGRSLTIEDVVVFSRRSEYASCALSAEAVEKIMATRALTQDLIGREVPIYGVSTGFGDSAHRQISASKTARLQQNMLRFLGSGTGPIASPEVTRAAMLLRANCLARGNSGVRLELVERLLFYLNNDVLPLIPERGSCGASGDLVPLSYVGAALVGEVEVLHDGEVKDSKELLSELSLEPLELEAKEGLALTNGTSFMSAFAALAVWDAEELALVSDLCTAMASEALLGNRGHFNVFIHEQKPHPGQVESARVIRNLLADSELALDSEDNPLFDAASGRVQSGGNFYGSHITQAMDSLKIAVANLCDLMDRQLELVVDEKFNAGLTPNLIPFFDESDPEAGLHHGFKGMQLCCSAMTAEALKLSNPASVFSRSTEAHNQDKVSMGSIAARDARSIIELAQNVAAIHLLAVCQALDLRGAQKASPKTRAAHELVRSRVPFLDGDRRMDTDIKEIVDLIRSGELSERTLPT